MRLALAVFGILSFAGAPPCSAQVKDTSVAEIICRGEGFTPQTPAYGKCVIEKMAKLTPAGSPGKVNEQAQPAKVLDPYASLESDFARADLAYRRGNYDAAFSYMLKAARAGDVKAFVPVARYYIDGTGTLPDPAKGVFWLRKAEMNKNADAYPLLARAYLDGQGVPQDIQKAQRFVEIARNAGAVRQSQEIERMVENRVGADAITCARYGMALGTAANGQCRLQMQHARQQAEIQQRQYELQVAQYQQQLAAYEAQQKALEREKRRREGEVLMRMAQGLLGGQSFSDSSLSAYGLDTTRPTPPPPPATQNYTIRLPNGNQVYCNYNSIASYMSCR